MTDEKLEEASEKRSQAMMALSEGWCTVGWNTGIALVSEKGKRCALERLTWSQIAGRSELDRQALFEWMWMGSTEQLQQTYECLTCLPTSIFNWLTDYQCLLPLTYYTRIILYCFTWKSNLWIGDAFAGQCESTKYHIRNILPVNFASHCS